MLDHKRIETLGQPGKQRVCPVTGGRGTGRVGSAIRPEEDAQEGHDGEEGEQGQHRPQRVEDDVARQVQAVAEDELEEVPKPPHAPCVPT